MSNSADNAVTAHPIKIIDPATGLASNTGLILGSQGLYAIVSPIAASLAQANKLYSVGLDVVAATAGSDNALIYLRNPNGSGKVISVIHLYAGSTVTNVAVEFKLTADPTVSVNGTAQTAVSRNVGGGAPTASALITTLPTVSAVGAVLSTAEYGQNSTSFDMNENYSILVQPGHALLVTGNPSSNNRNCTLTLVWSEH